MRDILTKIVAAMAEFEADATKRIDGNKSAGVRSRHKAQDLRELLKEWRKASANGKAE